MSYRQFPHTEAIYVGTSAQTADFVCTGTNDDVVINAAITAATVAGTSTVLLRPGTYYIGNQIVLASNIHLTSEGLGTVSIVIASGFNDTSNTAGILAAG